MTQQTMNRIGELLQENNMTRGELAQKLGYSVSHISRLIYGQRALTVCLLIKLMSVFQCEACEIIPALKRS